MASSLGKRSGEVRLLDPGAGGGALIEAFVRFACVGEPRPERISVTAYELDGAVLPALTRTLQRCESECRRAGTEFSARVHHKDFIEEAISLTRSDLFAVPKALFDAAILNPPYRKISSDSPTRRLLRQAGIETSNLYTGFLALSANLLSEGGEMVAICPRSFCNGPYFRPFREQFLDMMSLRWLHLFGSRSAAFRHDGVLQENIILHAVKSPQKPETVLVSASNGEPGDDIARQYRPYNDVVSPEDPERFIHFAPSNSDVSARRFIRRLTTSLGELGLDVSTGRVVAFRAKQFLVSEARPNSVPLIHPSHFAGAFVRWPASSGRKPNAIQDTERTQGLLVSGATYVLVKRFTSKEERRRVVACIYDPHQICADRVGFENHLNYFHARGRGLPMAVAKGLAAFLNSTPVDTYFRQFNGHTQVNATDLRSLPYPTRAELESLGRKIGAEFPSQQELDALVERELF